MSTPPSPSGPAGPAGAADDGGRRRKKGLLWGALALVALVVIALLLSRCGDDDPAGGTDAAGGSSAVSSSPSSSAPGSASEPAPSESSGAPESPGTPGGTDGPGATGSPGGGGDVVLGEQSLLQIAGRGGPGGESPFTVLSELAGQDATATAVRVQSVPADEGFWVGPSATERIWVQLTGDPGESPYRVRQGDLVDFEGVLVAHEDGFAAEVGVDGSEGAGQLTEQGHHLEVATSAVRLSR